MQTSAGLLGTQQDVQSEAQPDHLQDTKVTTEIAPFDLRSSSPSVVAARHFAGVSGFKRANDRREHFVAGHRTIGQVDYPALSFDGASADGTAVFEGLYLDLFPADFAERHRFYSFAWMDIHPPDVPGTGLAEFDAIVSSARVRPLGAELLSTDFSNPLDGVMDGSVDDPGRYEAGYLDGQFQVQVLDRQIGQPLAAFAGTIFVNVGVSVTATVVSQDPDPTLMVGCRWRTDKVTGYRLAIRPERGKFQIDRADSLDTTVDLVTWQQSSAVHLGSAPNRLEIRCTGTTITALINDVEVASVEDATYAWGLPAFGAAPSDGATVDGRFANFLVTQR
jgi:hypothetical protein